MLVRFSVLVTLCVATHYILALCWPIVSLLVGIGLAGIWVVRSLVKCCGRMAFWIHRWSGGAPEALVAEFFGPGTGTTPETSDLRKLKKGSEDKWVLVKRDGKTVIFKVSEASSIKSSGLYLTVEPDTMRGDPELVSNLKGFDRVHACRNDQCSEDGQHFKMYAISKEMDPGKFQLASTSHEVQRAGKRVFDWLSAGAAQAAKRAKDYASESETEQMRCFAHQIRWEGAKGPEVLSEQVCTVATTDEVDLLVEDRLGPVHTCSLCPKHSVKYHKARLQLKCVKEGCQKVGQLTELGLRLCGDHGEVGTTSSTPSRRSSRSRSRHREVPEEPEEDEEEGPRLRRRVRVAQPNEDQEVAMLLQEVKEEPLPQRTRAARARSSSSPGHTPKSSVQRNLARLGLVNSPDKRAFQTTLEEFMEQFAEGKDFGLEEEDVRKQMAVQYGMNLVDLTKTLYEQATEEQHKGTKGLTKFLAKWRKQTAAEELSSDRSRVDSWSLVEEGAPSTISLASSTPGRTTSRASSTTPNTPKAKTLVVLPPPGIYGQTDRKAGTGPTEGRKDDTSMTEIAKAIQQQTNELATLVRAQQDNANVQLGTIKALGKQSEELVFLLRACGQYTVQVGGEEHGAGLAQALLAAQAGASTKLRTAGFKQKVAQRLAIGLAGPFWGTQEKYALSAADFVACSDAELDQYTMEVRTGKQQAEQRPPMPTRYEDWLSRVKRQNDIWALVYGAEWRGVREHAAQVLGEWHLGSPHKWPIQVVCEVWEELHWRFVEELKDELRKIKKLSGRESMTLQDLKFYALMPDEEGNPALSLPRTFDLHHPAGWFVTEVLPRIERRQERMLWKMTWEGPTKQRVSGQPAGGGDHVGGQGSLKDSGIEKPTLKSLWGPKLTPEEVSRAKERAPTDREGKLLCWGNITHLGCGQTGCQRSHEPLRGTFESLEPAVQIQLLRRGGLKRMKLETKDSVWEKIKELRAQVAKDKANKIKDGKDVCRAGQGASEAAEVVGEKAGGLHVTWAPPEEMVEVDYTQQEETFQQLVKGPDPDVFKNVTKEGKPHEGRQGESAPDYAKNMVKEAQRLADGPVLQALESASDDLYAWAATRVANDPNLDLETLLEDMVQFGLGELAEEAALILEINGLNEKAGHTRRCHVEEVTWEGEGPGVAQVHIDGKVWTMYDYREEIYMTEELAGMLGVVEAMEEKRQCVTKVLAAGILQLRHGVLPTMLEVAEEGQQLRLEQARLAVEAEGAMGHAEVRVSPVEREIRMYSHDILKAHHDKDYRALAVFPLEALSGSRVAVIRLDYKGDILLETITGQHWKPGQPDLWCLVWKGHMTLLTPPTAEEGHRLIASEDGFNTPSLGFAYYWHQRHDQPKVAPGLVVCRLCKPLKKVGGEETSMLLRKETCLPALGLCVAGGTSAPRMVHPATRAVQPKGLVLREFFAGHGVITKAWLAEGADALPPVELYEDPHRQRGARPDHDLSKPEVQAKYKKEVQDHDSNVHWIACPCTTFCDWQLQNNGTRTFEVPEGQPTQKEQNGNVLSNFGAELFETSMLAGNFPIAESSGTSGRYPKQWNLPAWRRLIQRPDVDFIELDMCAFGLGPPDTVNEFYKHRTGLVFPHHPPLRQALLRLCQGLSPQHKHIGLKGARPGSDVTRCTEAGVYTPRFVQAVVLTLLETLQVGGGGVRRAPQTMSSPAASLSTPLPLTSSTSLSTPLPLTSSTSLSTPLPLTSSTSLSTPSTVMSSTSRSTFTSSVPREPEGRLDCGQNGKAGGLSEEEERQEGTNEKESESDEGESQESLELEELVEGDRPEGVWKEEPTEQVGEPTEQQEGDTRVETEPHREGEDDGWLVDTQKGVLRVLHRRPRHQLCPWRAGLSI